MTVTPVLTPFQQAQPKLVKIEIVLTAQVFVYFGLAYLAAYYSPFEQETPVLDATMAIIFIATCLMLCAGWVIFVVNMIKKRWQYWLLRTILAALSFAAFLYVGRFS